MLIPESSNEIISSGVTPTRCPNRTSFSTACCKMKASLSTKSSPFRVSTLADATVPWSHPRFPDWQHCLRNRNTRCCDGNHTVACGSKADHPTCVARLDLDFLASTNVPQSFPLAFDVSNAPIYAKCCICFERRYSGLFPPLQMTASGDVSPGHRRGAEMTQAFDSLPSPIRQCIEQIQKETDRDTLTRLFVELNLLLEQNEQEFRPKLQRSKGVWFRSERRRA
jgi:hypothetical protein